MGETVRVEVRIAVTVDVPKEWAGRMLNYVHGGGVEPDPPVTVCEPVTMTGPDGLLVESSMAPIVLSARPLPEA
jgi:hypothetical protein